jgi:aryl carrier-like protein
MATAPLDRQALIQKLIQKRLEASRVRTPAASANRGNTPIPLSWGQRQIWLHSQLVPDVPLYNEPFTVYREGPTDVGCLRRSLNELIRRHEILRTTFPIVDGEPVQVILPELKIELPVCELELESKAIELATVDGLCVFDLATGPLLRARLVRLGETDYRLFLTLHHLIFDGVSIYHVLLPELAAIYEAFSKGESSPIPPPAFQYADYALWQRERIGAEGPKEQAGYWRDQLGSHRPRLTLPADRACRQLGSFRGELFPFFIGQDLTAALKRLARESGSSLYMVLLAAFHLLLYRHTGQEDIVIGTVTAGRNQQEFGSTFGYFLNPLVLRTSIAGKPTFRELIGRVRKVTLEALDNADIPFELVARALDRNRDRRRNPFFDVLFSLEPPAGQPPSGWDLKQTRVDMGLSKFDLSVEFDERADGLDGRFVYNTGMFDRATIERMCNDWTALAASISERPDTVIDPPVLSAGPLPITEARNGNHAFVAPRNPTERALEEIWAGLLGSPDPIGVTDDFFGLGGHSLLVMRLRHAIEQRFGKSLTIPELYASPTIEQMASRL